VALLIPVFDRFPLGTNARLDVIVRRASAKGEIPVPTGVVDNQVGVVFIINGAQAGLELFDAASTWRKLAPKLVRSYAVDAIDRRGRPSQNRAPLAHMAFARAVEATPASAFPAIGEGSDVRPPASTSPARRSWLVVASST
jgi:hypothetical protein